MADYRVLTQAMGDLNEELVIRILKDFAATNPSGDEAGKVVNACQQGMAIVGDLFEKGEYFVGDLIFAGELLTTAIETLRPFLGGENTEKAGSILLATVQGDLHDIGKNIFRSMSEAAGFEVIDLGIDVPADTIVEKIKEIKPQIVGMSGVLTIALDSMKSAVAAITDAGLREQVKVIIGGNPVTAEACKHIAADAFTTNAAEGVIICQRWVD
ncbi:MULTISPECIES: cobalamin B12-binding domain-containing protein [Dehalobacter]|uniref:Cobalamin-binding protein n=1 Tax=Dehalobacter restrictus TaxID=55583 RepID=A0A857DGU1_9FIRM|nr:MULTISPECIES: cobalamin-dependent protein [Dehalobacter]MCG1025882.1 cobalamin-dependent protein [Dehalobacter sp.]OCZ52093.1 cobalamin-binding protein [Dehalobacter sp. TeCB1]QGZ99930.1 cobalamin-binding protein [Dehalobacter restrictus]